MVGDAVVEVNEAEGRMRGDRFKDCVRRRTFISSVYDQGLRRSAAGSRYAGLRCIN